MCIYLPCSALIGERHMRRLKKVVGERCFICVTQNPKSQLEHTERESDHHIERSEARLVEVEDVELKMTC